ncbi:hypothetical protein Clacol_007394 [Clathrus columnatus]|uniref:Uncharacterized protein n=1 Tax=Clathrus columnatus TaxID=1419009 RepID=A0AAV5AI03_9AGAM|nr:hypothetical protein Clacol_007394 [Clathrus columnatus]
MPPKPIITPAYSSNVEIYSDLDSAGLTPRTPFSRQTAQLEEGRRKTSRPRPKSIPVNEPISEGENEDEFDEIDLLQSQSHPLLHQELIPIRPPLERDDEQRKARSSWDRFRRTLVMPQTPIGLIFGCSLAVILILLIFVSINRHDSLLSYMGINTTAIKLQALDDESKARFNTSTVIDFSMYSLFPLTTNQYIQECWNIINDPHMKSFTPYWDTRPGAEFDVLHQKSTSHPPTCSSTITYILDGSVGLMADLAHIAIISAFARERNRTFFIYDENWNRGRWSDHFLPFSETQPGPEPGCSPPPSDEMVSCPRTARHWVTSARINLVHFANGFEDEFEDSYKSTIERKKPLYMRSRASLSEHIRPNKVNQGLIQKMRDEITQLTRGMNNTATRYISTHIRRGDRHAMSWKYNFSPNRQIPTQEYVNAVWKSYAWFYNISDSSPKPLYPPFIYLASDSAEASAEFVDNLTSNDTLAHTFNDENLKPFVYSLSTSSDKELRDIAPMREYVQSEWGAREEMERIKETRGVIVDFALMSGAWRTISASDDGSEFVLPQVCVCTLPSNLCKLAVDGLGWDYAFDWQNNDVGSHPRWVEIDNGGSVVPIWTPFEIFS